MNADLIKRIIEGALLAAGKPMDIAKIESLFEEEQCPPRDQIRAALEEVEEDCRGRGFELAQTASGYRFQVRQDLAEWVNRLWTEKPKRYSRAMLETLLESMRDARRRTLALVEDLPDALLNVSRQARLSPASSQ